MAELHDLDAHEQAAALAAGEVSSVELVQHHLDRIDAHDEALGAFITVTHERALRWAAELPMRDARPATPRHSSACRRRSRT